MIGWVIERKRSRLKSSQQKLAMVLPQIIARRTSIPSRFPPFQVRDRKPIKPPAKLSPAPVGSTTSVRGRGRGGKDVLVVEQKRPGIATLDDDIFGSESLNRLRGVDQVVPSRKQARFFVVEQQEVDPAQDFQQGFAAAIYPEVHRVESDQLDALHLFEHAKLQRRIDVAQEQSRAEACAGCSFGSKSANTLSWVSIEVRLLKSSE